MKIEKVIVDLVDKNPCPNYSFVKSIIFICESSKTGLHSSVVIEVSL